jgi:predicted lipoprotein with Yx(FWY)xxD motif
VACGLSGCGGSGAPAGSAPTYDVRSATLPGLGRVLVDGTGFTLYVYTLDNRGPSKCKIACARQWPPVLVPAGVRPTAGRGVDAQLLGIDRRADGTRQLTYDGWPLYTYVHDSTPGEVAGQAEDMGAWYVMSVSGALDRNPEPSAVLG